MANRGLERHLLLLLSPQVQAEWQVFNQHHHRLLLTRLHLRSSKALAIMAIITMLHFHRLLLEAPHNNHNHQDLQLWHLQAIHLLLETLRNNHNHQDSDNKLLPLPIRLEAALHNRKHQGLDKLLLLHRHLELLTHLICHRLVLQLPLTRHRLVRHLHPTRRLLVGPSLRSASRVRLPLQPILPLVQTQMHRLLRPLAQTRTPPLDLVIRRTPVNRVSSLPRGNVETVPIVASHMIQVVLIRAMVALGIKVIIPPVLLRHLETHHLDLVVTEEIIRTIAHLVSSLLRENVETEPTVNSLMTLAVGTLAVDLVTQMHLLEEDLHQQPHLVLVRLEVEQHRPLAHLEEEVLVVAWLHHHCLPLGLLCRVVIRLEDQEDDLQTSDIIYHFISHRSKRGNATEINQSIIFRSPALLVFLLLLL